MHSKATKCKTENALLDFQMQRANNLCIIEKVSFNI